MNNLPGSFISKRSLYSRNRPPKPANRIYKLKIRRTLTPEEEEQAKAVYKDFFTPEHQFKVDPGQAERLKHDL